MFFTLFTDKALCLARRKKCHFHENINGCFGERVLYWLLVLFRRPCHIAVNWKCYFDVSALCLQVSVAFVKGKMLRNYLPRNMFLSNKAFTPASRCQHCSTLDFPAATAQRGMAQPMISRVSSSFLQPKACRAEKTEMPPLFSLRRGFYWDGGYFFFTLAWRDQGLGLPSNTHSHSISLHPLSMSVCVCERDGVSERGWEKASTCE